MFRVARLINFSFSSSSFFKSKAWSKKKIGSHWLVPSNFYEIENLDIICCCCYNFFSFFDSFKMKRIEKSIAYVHISRERIPWNVLHMQHYINSFSLFHFLSSQQKFFSMKYFVYGGMCYLDRKGFLQTQTKGKFGDISINNKCNITTTTIREMVLFAENCTFMCQVLCKMTCGFVQFRFKNVLSQFVTIF